MSSFAPSRLLDRHPVAVRFGFGVVLLVLGVLAIISFSAEPGHAATLLGAGSSGSGSGSGSGTGAGASSSGFGLTINGPDGTPSSAITTLIAITLLSVAPSLLLMMTSFTKIFVVLAMTRNALGLNTIPPTQVLAGLSIILTVFIMWPTFSQINSAAVQPYLAGHIDFTAALQAGSDPLRKWMLHFTRQDDIALVLRAGGQANPKSTADVSLITLMPAFMLSELRSAFIIGFVVYLPFLVIDLVVSSALMGMGMMMLPPVMVSLPFKVLLFVLVDGWGLLIQSLVKTYTGTL